MRIKQLLKYSILFTTSMLLSIIFVSLAHAVDLSNYPEPFVANSIFDASLVVGDNAKASDVIGVTDIAMSLQFDMQKKRTIVRQGCGEYEVNELVRVGVGAAKLASKLKGKERSENLIIVGGACANSVAAFLYGYPEDCTQGYEYGKAKIKLFDHKNGKYALLVAGLTDEDTRAAAQVVANYKEYKDAFVGNELVVTDTSLSKPKVTRLR
ncbi:TPA: hypothetical protein HA246_00685 [Candidatus Woesearchaeota archaeon]|nr:hypothetical protein [Candidatus Woesearchaeota archaeon]